MTIVITSSPGSRNYTLVERNICRIPKPCFIGNDVHDYSKTNERIDLKLMNILKKNINRLLYEYSII